MKAIVLEQKPESSVRLPWQMQANKQLIAHQLSFDKEVHDRKLKCVRCLLT